MNWKDWTRDALIGEIERLRRNAEVADEAAEASFETTDEFVQSDERYQIICDHTVDWEVWTLPDGRMEYCSPSSEFISGHPPARFLSDPGFLREIILGEDRPVWDELVREPQASGQIQFRIRRADGKVRWIEHTYRKVFDRTGKDRGVRFSNRDATARIEAQESAWRSMKELEKRNALLEENSVALRVTLQHLRDEEGRVRADVLANVQSVILPLVEQLERSTTHSPASETVRRLRAALLRVGQPVVHTLSIPEHGLTPRELEICAMIRRGLRTKEIAGVLSVSPDTVRTQRRSIRRKLGLTGAGKNLAVFLQRFDAVTSLHTTGASPPATPLGHR